MLRFNYPLLFFHLIALCFLSPLPLFSAEKKNLKISETQTENLIPQTSHSWFSDAWIMPQVSVVMPSALRLTQPNFKVDYIKQVANFSQGGIVGVKPILTTPEFEWSGLAKLGLSYRSGLFDVVRANGETGTESLTLLWVPMSLGTTFVYSIPDMAYFKPSITLGGGVHWFSQTQKNSPTHSDFWIPYYFITPALSFLSDNTADWFRGFTFGISFQQGLSSKQKVSGISFDMGIHVYL